MMTSFAFILGLLAARRRDGRGDAGAQERRHAGVRRDIAASFIGIFVIPPLYVTFQGLRERLKPSSRPRPALPAKDKAMVKQETPAE